MHWFSHNQMKVNAFLTSSNEDTSNCIDNNLIKKRKYEKLLGVKVDQKLNFNAHINDIVYNYTTNEYSIYGCLNSVTAL